MGGGRWEPKQIFCFLHHLTPKENLQELFRNMLSLLEYLGQNHDLDCREQETTIGVFGSDEDASSPIPF